MTDQSNPPTIPLPTVAEMEQWTPQQRLEYAHAARRRVINKEYLSTEELQLAVHALRLNRGAGAGGKKLREAVTKSATPSLTVNDL